MKRHAPFLIIVALFFLWMRLPSLSEGMPYFYNEDEAHHFNRTVNMVKAGEWNPRYFHKPSLHFYLRIPVVSASFLWAVKEGEIRSVKEIQTRDSEGLGGYSFSASHPRLVVWNRALSVFLGLLVGLLVYGVIFQLVGCKVVSTFGFLSVAVSPELVRYGAVIGVDVVMIFFVVLTVFCALASLRAAHRRYLYVSAIAAGLAVSSKYNALPIVFVPVVAALLSGRGTALSFVQLLVSGLAFFAASPFILVELPLFLDQFAYEIWHYGVAGHAGHSEEPGIRQALFYGGWLKNDALGIGVLLSAVLGFVASLKRAPRETVVLALFPILFFLLMASQKTNFVRNMTVILPFVGIFATLLFGEIARRSRVAGVVAFLVCMAFPTYESFAVRNSQSEIPETRIDVADWLSKNAGKETAIFSEGEFAASVFRTQGVSEIQGTVLPSELYVRGFDRFVAKPGEYPHTRAVVAYEGVQEKQRIVKNPALSVYDILGDTIERDALNTVLESEDHRVTFSRTGDIFSCREGSEEYCWVTDRISRIYLKGLQEHPNFSGRDGLTRVSMTFMTPWKEQALQATFDDFLAFVPIPRLKPAGEWETVDLDLPYQELKSGEYFILSTNVIRSPAQWLGSRDSRRLGVAIKSFEVKLR